MNDKYGELTDVLAEIKEDIRKLFFSTNELVRTSVDKDEFNTERDKLRNDVGKEIRLVRDVKVEIKEIIEFLQIVNRDIQYLLGEDRKNRR